MRAAQAACLVALFALAADAAFAQAPGGGGPAQGGGGNVIAKGASAGTLIASVMEQIGYNSQARVLTDMNKHLNALGALIYLGVITSMVLTVALSGNYRTALWGLIGPPLFFWASGLEFAGQKNTIDGQGVEWRFGAFDDTKVLDEKAKLMKRPEINPAGEVSFLFHKYNELISEIVQRGISIITNEDVRKQMRFMSRQRLMEELFGEQILNPDIKALVGYFMVHCSEEISYARMIALGNRDPDFRKEPDYAMAKQEYCRLWTEPNKEFVPGPWQDYVYDAGLWNGLEVTQQDHLENLERDYGVVSCEQMWKWAKDGAKREIYRNFAFTSILVIPPSGWAMLGSEPWDKATHDVVVKLTSKKKVAPHRTESFGDPCAEAGQGGAGGQGGGDGEGQGPASDMEALADIFTGYLVRQSLMSPPPAEIMSRVQSGDHGFTGSKKFAFHLSNPNTKQELLRRQAQHQFGRARRYEAFMLLQLIPYLQGMLLYVLAISYPFFTVLLLLPGKAGSFFMWMALWAWAKSWDLGWAFIIVADDVIWQLMPKTAFFNPDNPGAYNSPISLLEAAFDGDHSYSTSTYWLLLSTMISGVPIITAQAVLGSKKAIAGIMLKSFGDFVDQFSSGAQDYVATQQVRSYTMAAERDAATVMAIGSMLEYAKSAGARDRLMQALKGGIISENFQARQVTQAYTDAQQERKKLQTKLDGLKREGAGAQQIAQAEAKLEAARKAETAAFNKKQKFIEDAGLRAAQRGPAAAATLAEMAKGMPGGEGAMKRLSEMGFDFNRMNSEGDVKSILEALQGTDFDPAADKGDGNPITNDQLRAQYEQQRMAEWLAQVQGYSKQDLGEAVAVLGGAYGGGFGHGLAGPVGAHNLFLRMVDAGAASNMANYQYQYRIAAMQMKRQEALNQWAAYEMNKNPLWLNRDYARAYVSGNRTEWFFHRQAPLDSFWQFEQTRQQSEAFFRSQSGMERGAYQRLFFDLPSTIWGNSEN